MKRLFSVLLIISALSSCAKKSYDKITDIATASNNTIHADTTKVTDTLSYIALGDSYTIGQSVSLNQSFPYQLTAQLGLKANPTIIATTGWTTDELISAIKNSGLTFKTYDFVTLLIGVNDQFRGISKDTYRINFIALLNTAIKFAKGNKNRVTVISIPDYSVTPFASYYNTQERAVIAQQIDEFNAINKNESDKAGVAYLDITDISRRAATDPALITIDGLHPSAKMYGLWVQRLTPLIKAQLVK
jgi:lysophospholipase L1-like esterase